MTTQVPIMSSSTQDRLNRQKLNEKRALSSDFQGNPGFDMNLKYKLRPAMDTFKIVSYNHRSKRYKIRHQVSQNQFLYVPASFITAEMHSTADEYTHALEQNFLKERFRSFQLEKRIFNLQKELQFYKRRLNDP